VSVRTGSCIGDARSLDGGVQVCGFACARLYSQHFLHPRSSAQAMAGLAVGAVADLGQPPVLDLETELAMETERGAAQGFGAGVRVLSWSPRVRATGLCLGTPPR
jgi:hypothetical protein